jgi:hypothetical protein
VTSKRHAMAVRWTRVQYPSTLAAGGAERVKKARRESEVGIGEVRKIRRHRPEVNESYMICRAA